MKLKLGRLVGKSPAKSRHGKGRMCTKPDGYSIIAIERARYIAAQERYSWLSACVRQGFEKDNLERLNIKLTISRAKYIADRKKRQKNCYKASNETEVVNVGKIYHYSDIGDETHVPAYHLDSLEKCVESKL